MSFPHELTIGMIVKNEEKYLRACLESMKPLRDEISCQLIITDTGSTDGTKEIAKELADVYLEFDWCNDFAKARNTGVEHATGRWFFWVDADNQFDESILSLVDFLKSPVSHTVDSASILIRSYESLPPQSSRYQQHRNIFLANFKEGKREFVQPVHESIPTKGDSFPLELVLHHYGYVATVREQKKERNEQILLAALRKDNSNTALWFQLIGASSPQSATLSYTKEALSIVEKQKNGDALALYHLRLKLFVIAVQEGDRTLFGAQEPLLKGTYPTVSCETEYYGGLLEYYLRYRGNVMPMKLFLSYGGAFLRLPQVENETQPFLYEYNYIHPTAYHRFVMYLLSGESPFIDREKALIILRFSPQYEKIDHEYKFPYLGDYVKKGVFWKDFTLLSQIIAFLEPYPDYKQEVMAFLLQNQPSLEQSLKEQLLVLLEGKDIAQSKTLLEQCKKVLPQSQVVSTLEATMP